MTENPLPPPEVSALEVKEAMQIPAVFSNRFQVALTNTGFVRIAFGETLDNSQPAYFRGAFLCHVSDAAALIGVLQQVMQDAANIKAG